MMIPITSVTQPTFCNEIRVASNVVELGLKIAGEIPNVVQAGSNFAKVASDYIEKMQSSEWQFMNILHAINGLPKVLAQFGLLLYKLWGSAHAGDLINGTPGTTTYLNAETNMYKSTPGYLSYVEFLAWWTYEMTKSLILDLRIIAIFNLGKYKLI